MSERGRPRSVDFREVAKVAARLAHAKQAEAIVAFDMRRQTTITEYFVIATVHSSAQMRAIHDALVRHFRAHGPSLIRSDGTPSTRWMVLDYGGVVMHLMHPQVRALYRLEQLWDGVRRVSWQKRQTHA